MLGFAISVCYIKESIFPPFSGSVMFRKNQVATVLFLGIVTVFSSTNLFSQDGAANFSIPLFKTGEEPKETIPANQNPENQVAGSGRYQIDLFGGKIIVPELKGLTWNEAEEKLTALNLKAEKKNESGLSVDVVDYQNPKAGLEVAIGTPVGLRLVTQIPDVTGKTLVDAYDLLKDGGFKIKYYKEWDKDYDVTGQFPRSGGMDIRGKTITLQCNVAVPDVRKKTVAEAKKILEKSDLYALISAQYRDDDIVFDQGVRPGKMIPRKFQVELAPGVIVPNILNADLATAEFRLIEKGIPAKIVAVNRVVTQNVNDHGKAVVSAQAVKPGGFIFRGNTLEIKVVQAVYQEQRVPDCTIKAPVYGNGYNPPVQQSKCPECGQPCNKCRCFVGG